MIPQWAAALSTLAYVCALFGIAHFGDTAGRKLVGGRARSTIYALGLTVYCTSWTFFGSVGLASTTGFEFLPIYIGPFVVIGLCYPFVLRLVRLARSENITSVADFVAARYGKADKVAISVTILCVIGTVPYIALQLKAVESALGIVLGSVDAGRLVASAMPMQSGLLVPLVLAGFAIAFGTRRVDATEHQDGLMLAVATESIVKLASFLAVGLFVMFAMFGGIGDLYERAAAAPAVMQVFLHDFDPLTLVVMTLLSAIAILLLPRQFHVTVVENRNERDVATAAWLFPLYLIAINLFVVPLGAAGLLTFPGGAIDRDMTVLALPLQAGAQGLSVFAMLGGLSAATAMIVVECVALSIMISNDLVLPVALRRRAALPPASPGDIGGRLLIVRRLAILALLALGHLYLSYTSAAGLASIGLISFACIAQIAPAFFGGLVWRRGTASGAMAGIIAGGVVWFYTLLLPSFDLSGTAFEQLVTAGPFGLDFLRPTALFGWRLAPLAHGTLASLGANILAYAVFSLARAPSRIERLQGEVFIGASGLPIPGPLRLWRSSVSAGELEATVARYLGAERAGESFDSFFAMRGLPEDRSQEADVNLMRYAEHLLASAIGAASSRLVLSLVLRRRNVSKKTALRLVDTASAAIQYNRDVLQYALDFARQGITVLDRDLRLVCWNREFRDLFAFSGDALRVGVALEDIVRSNAARGLYGPGNVEDFVAARIDSFVNSSEPTRLRLRPSGRVIEMRSARLPEGGLITTHTDVTAQVDSEEALAAANETLEQRVRARTEELVALNAALSDAKAVADEANLSKTRFLAAASHDILQPLNAARLYASALSERMHASVPVAPGVDLAENVDASLEAVEDIITALLDISKLDAGAMKAEIADVSMEELFTQLAIEFAPLARASNVTVKFVRSRAILRSDRRLLRRLLQNLVSNAIKYSPEGRVLVGVRRRGGARRIEVYDTGLGVPAESHQAIFEEFHRLAPAQKAARGIGLGLSIVQRLSQVLGHGIGLRSQERRGSMFWVEAASSAAASLAPAHAPAKTAAAAGSLAGLRAIVIDNEPKVLEGMCVLLRGWGCEVAPGASAQDLPAGILPPDVVIADYHLDDGNGLDAITGLRARYGADLPAVLVTADRSESLRAAAAASSIHLLAKPLRPAALRALLAQWRVSRSAAE